MRFAAPLLFILPILAGCAVADEPPQIESDASACATLASCGCTPGMQYTCPSGRIVTCGDGGVWPESPCGPVEAGAGDATTHDAAAGDSTTASDAPEAATNDDAAGDAPDDVQPD